MSSWTPTKYKTTNWSSYNDALKRRGSLTIWFDPSMIWAPPPSGRRGRQQACSDAAIQVCLTLKVKFGMPLRQVTGFIESLLGLAGLNWGVPDYSTLCRRQKTLMVEIPYRGGNGPLHLLIDSTGIKAEGEGEWHTRKHGGPRRRIWRKVHIGIDEETLEIRAVEGEQANATGSREPANGSHIGDAPMLPELLSQIPLDEEIGTVTGDGAYDTRKCHDAIADRGAEAFGHVLGPMAAMPSLPPRKNAKPWKPTTAGVCARNEILRAVKYLGPVIWRRWIGCHRRSCVEAKMHCVKRLGQSPMARDFDRQVAELKTRCAVMNRNTALGKSMTMAAG